MKFISSSKSYYSLEESISNFSELRDDFIGPEIPLLGGKIKNDTLLIINFPQKNPAYTVLSGEIKSTGKLLREIRDVLKIMLSNKPRFSIPGKYNLDDLCLDKIYLFEPRKAILVYINTIYDKHTN